jgi:hypothetical protein
MAVIPATEVKTPFDANGIRLWKWEGLQEGDTGEPVPCPHYADKSVQVIGTFGSGGTCRIEGSNMPLSPTYFSLKDSQKIALDFTSADG